MRSTLATVLLVLLLSACSGRPREYFTGHVISCVDGQQVSILSPNGILHVIDLRHVPDAPFCSVYDHPGALEFSVHFCQHEGTPDHLSIKITPGTSNEVPLQPEANAGGKP